MTFERTWILFIAWLPLAWAALSWRNTARRGALLLKAAALAGILLAIAEPRLTILESKMAVAVLVDTSASVSDEDLQRASDIARRIESARGRNWVQVMPFARSIRGLTPEENGRTLLLRHAAAETGHATDLERAVREAVATLPAGRVPRVVLISDGKENLGSIARGAWQARQLGIPIDTIPLEGRKRPALRLESVTLPKQAFSGERFPVDLVVNSPQKAKATVEIKAAGKLLGTSPVSLQPGANQLRAHASLSTIGAVDLSGSIRAENLGEVQFAQAVAIRRPRVLFISQDPVGSESHLFKALQQAEFEMDKPATGIPDDIGDYQILVLNNWNLEGMPERKKAQIEEFIKQGGGLLVIGGERNVYKQKPQGAPEDPLEKALPAKISPPRTPEGTCVILILDKSSSMEGKKIELARLAAIGVVDNLRPIDMVGVLIFDNSFHWAVPVRKAEERTLIKRIISGITPDGGTQIAPALQEGYRRIVPLNAVYKHIVLLTDGISEEGDSLSLAREAAQRQITISTVGLGQDVNRAYLERVANLAKGKSYFLSDPSGLEQILLKDVQEHTGSTAVERAIRARVQKKAEVLEGVGLEAAPPLYGYVRYEAKPTTDVLVTVEPKDPLLVRWQYGLGRAAIFTSDAKSRWAKRWVGWSGYDKLWSNLFRDLLPHAQAGEASADYNSANDELVVDYRLDRNISEPEKTPDIFVFGPDGFHRPLTMDKVASGAYRGHVRIDHRQGLFRVRPLVESRAFPEIGFYRQEQELNDYGSDQNLLRNVSEFTGGRFNPGPSAVFDAGDRRVTSTMRLWPALIAIAVVLNLIELFLRKWRGIVETLRPRKAEPVYN